MAESDIERLRQFGQQVQTKKEKTEPSRNRLLPKIDAKNLKERVVFLKSKFSDFYTSLIEYVLHRFVLLKSMRYHQKKGSLRQIKNIKKQIGRFNEVPTTIVEYQKQWGNTSIIVRRRKKVSLMPESNELIRFPPSSAIAYYFHRLDTKEQEQKNLFSPRDSIWDLDYRCKNTLWIRIKSFFQKRT